MTYPANAVSIFPNLTNEHVDFCSYLTCTFLQATNQLILTICVEFCKIYSYNLHITCYLIDFYIVTYFCFFPQITGLLAF